jgi:lyso-ornithine lipid O-acyltransferase
MRWAKFTAIASLWAFFFAFIVLVHLWISVLRIPNRWEIISRLTCSLTFLLRRILNIKVTLVGDAGQLEGGGTVIISNHLSYVDGIVLGSIFPAVFVTKREVKKWPIVGLWTTVCGTIFVNRQRKELVMSLITETSRKLNAGANILLFPEGHASNGEKILPFQTAPLAAPLRNRSIIVPVTLVYKSIDDQAISRANRDLIYCYDDMDFAPHFWKLLALRSVECMVTVQPKIECFRYENNSAGRKRLAADCYDRVLGRRVSSELPKEEKGREAIRIRV